MAKKDAYYFQHDANALHDPKIMKLRMNMGMEGYGMWWAFLEMCRNENSSEHPYTIEEPNANQMVMMMCGVDKTTADTFIATCRTVGLITSENGRLFSESFIERMTEIDIIREKRKTNGAKGGRPKKKPNGLAKQKQNKSIREENSIGKNIYSNNPKPKFVKPTHSELAAYITAKNYVVDPDAFMDYQESVGWKVGNKPMKDWKRALGTWNRREQKNRPQSPQDAFSGQEMSEQQLNEILGTPEEDDNGPF